jgi:hypothetical protein
MYRLRVDIIRSYRNRSDAGSPSVVVSHRMGMGVQKCKLVCKVFWREYRSTVAAKDLWHESDPLSYSSSPAIAWTGSR